MKKILKKVLMIAIMCFITTFLFAGHGYVEMEVLPKVVAITTDYALGAGIIVTEDGYIVTNRHVVGPENIVDVWLSDFKQYKGRVVGFHSECDIAVIKIEPLEPLVFFTEEDVANTNQIFIGDEVYAIGHPLGFTWSVTKGIISAERQDRLQVRYYQTDTSINPGNSGGPLVDKWGRFIGINTFGIPPNYAENIALAISVQSFIEEVIMLIDEDIKRLEIIKNVREYVEEKYAPVVQPEKRIIEIIIPE